MSNRNVLRFNWNNGSWQYSAPTGKGRMWLNCNAAFARGLFDYFMLDADSLPSCGE